MKITLFWLYFIAELAATVYLASVMEVFMVFIEIGFSAVFGVLVFIEMPSTFRESLWKVMQNRLSANLLSRAFSLRIIGAFLLVMPGFLGDAIGLILVVASAIMATSDKPPRKDDNIIDVEVIDVADGK
ncbi:MAG: FxsA family protein [Helicobacteraceae bacterium]|jgi:UPF0716 family protein affecting phage T7 exclusion|nr:FxsA family protein [Helicobacteraceae bacterium]